MADAENATPVPEPAGVTPAETPPSEPAPAQKAAAADARLSFLDNLRATTAPIVDRALPDESADDLPPLQGEDDKLLFGPTFRPNEAITAGMGGSGGGRPVIPVAVLQNLPLLGQMATRPDTDPKVVVLLQEIMRELGE